MTCCENDIQFMGLIAKGMNLNQYQNRDWVEVTGRMAVEKHAAYKGKGPVMHVISIGPCEKPQQEVVTFLKERAPLLATLPPVWWTGVPQGVDQRIFSRRMSCQGIRIL